MKKKDLVSKRVRGFPMSCQQAYQMLFKKILSWHGRGEAPYELIIG